MAEETPETQAADALPEGESPEAVNPTEASAPEAVAEPAATEPVAAEQETPAPRERPSVPGADLEVDIVPEGVDPLASGAIDPYAAYADAEEAAAAPGPDEEEVIRLAVKGMMPRNRLARKQLTKLKIYAGPQHPHVAQQPAELELRL